MAGLGIELGPVLSLLLRNASIQAATLEPNVFLVPVGEGRVMFNAPVVKLQRHAVAVQLVAAHPVSTRPLFLAL